MNLRPLDKGPFAMRSLLPLVCVLLCSCEGDLKQNDADAGLGGTAGLGTGGTGGNTTGGDGGTLGSSTGGSSDPGVKTYPLFVAQGQMGRTTVSCDFGETWVDDHGSLDSYRGVPYDDLTCANLPPNPEGGDRGNCDHNAHPARGIAFGGGDFMATFGWGEPGLVEKSSDGGAWTNVYDSAATREIFGGLAYVQSTWVLAGSDSVRRSVDGGKTWSEKIGIEDAIGNRRTGQTSAFGGRILVAADQRPSGQAQIKPVRVSSDAGLTWWAPDTIPPQCGQGIQTEGGIVANGDTWLVVSGNGFSCKSTDGGKNWTAHRIWDASSDEQIRSNAVADGTQFMVWGWKGRYISTDGETWMTEQTTPTNLGLSAVAADGDGHLVAASGEYDAVNNNGDYVGQRFYTSSDGLTWNPIPLANFKASHPIRSIAFGLASKKPSGCP